MSLRRRLIGRINAFGPITVAEYMDACLNDPQNGYYATRPALGAAGDFITAPHVSQMFGELIGAWSAEVWRRLGSPQRVRLVELGPGDGAMMSDILRAAEAWPGFRAAIDLVLLEKSEPLRARQAEKFRARWISDLGEIDADAPVIVLANEFLDCFPIRQAVMGREGWRERRIGLGPSRDLEFVNAEPRPELDQKGREGDVFEWSPELVWLASQLGVLVSRARGAALFIDYAGDGLGDTLQSILGHRKTSPLDQPGQADLTARVDLGAFLAAAAPGKAHGPISQATFLQRLGLEARAAALTRAFPDQAAKIARQVRRLVWPGQMGELFKVACIAESDLSPPGFA